MCAQPTRTIDPALLHLDFNASIRHSIEFVATMKSHVTEQGRTSSTMGDAHFIIMRATTLPSGDAGANLTCPVPGNAEDRQRETAVKLIMDLALA
jgi:hypothetical protein